MAKSIADFILNVFGGYAWIAVILLAMVPLIELRGAIPIACALMPEWEAYIFGVIGSTVPALFIVPLLLPFFAWLKKKKFARRIAESFDNHFKNKSKGLKSDIKNEKEAKKKEQIKFLGVLLFVAVPLPLTGAWTGSAVAAYVGLDYKKSILAVLLGNMVSGAIMTVICTIFPNSENVILLGFLALIAIFILASLVIKFLKKTKIVEEVTAEDLSEIIANESVVEESTKPVVLNETKNKKTNNNQTKNKKKKKTIVVVGRTRKILDKERQNRQ